MPTEQHALTEAQTADRLGISAATLRNWRRLNKGPNYKKFGRAVRYLAEDLEAYIASSDPDPSSSVKRGR
jgi:transcriptional regulator with XRE-family HTH domain